MSLKSEILMGKYRNEILILKNSAVGSKIFKRDPAYEIDLSRRENSRTRKKLLTEVRRRIAALANSGGTFGQQLEQYMCLSGIEIQLSALETGQDIGYPPKQTRWGPMRKFRREVSDAIVKRWK